MTLKEHLNCIAAAIVIMLLIFPLYHDHSGKLCFGEWKSGWCQSPENSEVK